MPQSIVVVGGSIAGLTHGLQLKRAGNKVTILEREPVAHRSSHQAGISYKASMESFLAQYDDTGRTSSWAADTLHIAYRRWPSLYRGPISYKTTSWGLLYRILRANFDGFASEACPAPPPARQGDGEAVYLIGKQVTDMRYVAGKVTVCYSDVAGREPDGELEADLVIGADGLHSTVRDIVKASAVKEYSGYVSWRGTVPEKELSKGTADYFINGFSFNVLSRSYIICYVIPTDEGVFVPGERLVNWVWYYHLPEGSPQMKEVFTSSDGTFHRNTVARGQVAPAAWERVRAEARSQTAAPFAELLGRTDRPFVTKINDSLCTQARYWDDKVLLVGDALTTSRPHVALATEQAARQCLALAEVREGETSSLADWERQVTVFAKRIWLLSRIVGEFGMGSWISCGRAIVQYLWLIISLKLGG